MQCIIKDFKVDVLPFKGVPNSRYYVPNGIGENIDEYVTDKNGDFHKVCCSESGSTEEVNLIAGEGIEITGEFPEFTIAATGSSSPTRFGVLGEDDTQTQNREFLTEGYWFDIHDNNNYGLELFLDASNSNGSRDIYSYVENIVVNDGRYAFIDLFANSTGTPSIDIFIGGNNSDSVEIEMQPGRLDIYLDTNSELFISGIDQDDTATKILALDSVNNVKWVDKSTITGGGGYSDEQAQDAVFNAIIAGTAITTSYNDVGNSFTINHADTSSAASVDFDGAQVPDVILLDQFGHVTDITTRNLTLADLGYTSQRFGVSGEDATASENRSFSFENHIFAINDASYGAVIQLDATQPGGARDIYIQNKNSLVGDERFASFDIFADGTGEATMALFVNGLNVNSNDVGINLIPGRLILTVDTNSNLVFNGIDQDDTTSKVLALDISNNVRWIDKATISSGGSSLRFGLAGEDDVALQDRSMNMNEYNFAVTNSNSIFLEAAIAGYYGYINLDPSGGIGWHQDGANGQTEVIQNLGIHPDIQLYAANSTTESSRLKVVSDSISISPYLGNLIIDNLTNLSTQNRLLGQFGTSGQIGYTTIGTGLSLASGVLSNTVTVQRFGKAGEDTASSGDRTFSLASNDSFEFYAPTGSDYFGFYNTGGTSGLAIEYSSVDALGDSVFMSGFPTQVYFSSGGHSGDSFVEGNYQAGNNAVLTLQAGQLISGVNTVVKLGGVATGVDATSFAQVYREVTVGTGINARLYLDNVGAKLQAKSTIGGTYKGIIVKGNTDLVFENYPSTRADAGSTKAFYSADASGTVAYGPISSTTGQRFGVAGEDATATQNRMFDLNSFYMQWDNVNDWVVNTGAGSLVEISEDFFSFFTINGAATARTIHNQDSSTYEVYMDTTNNSYVAADGLPRLSLNRSDSSVYLQSAKINLEQTVAGSTLIGNLPNLATQNRLIGQFSTSGQIGYTTLGTNLSMTSGVLNGAGQRFGVATEDAGPASANRFFDLGSKILVIGRNALTTNGVLFQDLLLNAKFNDGDGYVGSNVTQPYSFYLNTEETGVTYSRIEGFYDLMQIGSARQGTGAKGTQIYFGPDATAANARLDITHNDAVVGGANTYGTQVKLRNDGLYLGATSAPNLAVYKGIKVDLSGDVTVDNLGASGDVIVGANNTGLLSKVSYADVVAGGQVVIFDWKFSTSVGINNPGSGNWRADSAVGSSVVALSINDITSTTGLDISALFAQVDGNWLIHIQQSNDATKFIQFSTSGTYIDHTTWWEVPVTYVQSSGFPFSNNTKCTFVFINENNSGSSGGITRTIVSTSGSITLGAAASTDYMYFVTGAHTMSMPAAAGNTNRYTIKNNHSANITVDTAGAENIEGAASISIAPQSSVDVISDNTNWWVV